MTACISYSQITEANLVTGSYVTSENKLKSYPDQNPTLTTSNHNQKHGPVCTASFTLAMEHVTCKCGAGGKLKCTRLLEVYEEEISTRKVDCGSEKGVGERMFE